MKKQGKCTLDKAHWMLCVKKSFFDKPDNDWRMAMAFEYHDHACDYARELVSKLVSCDKLGEIFKIDRRNNCFGEYDIIVSRYSAGGMVDFTLNLSVRAVFGTGSTEFENLVVS